MTETDSPATPFPPAPEAIAHLISPEQVARSRAEARAQGRRYYLGAPDKFGSPYRYASGGDGVLDKRHRTRERVASGAHAEAGRRYRAAHLDAERERVREAKRRYRATPEGYAAYVVKDARRLADRLGVARRPADEEAFLFAAATIAHGIKVASGTPPDIHHCREEIAEGGGHVPGNLCVMSRSLHRSWHQTARRRGTPVSTYFDQALEAGSVVPCPTLPGCYIEQALLEVELAEAA